MSFLSIGTEQDPIAVRELTEGLGADVAIEAVGVPATVELAVDLVRPAGRIANLGVHGKPATLHLQRLWDRNLTIIAGLIDTYSTPTPTPIRPPVVESGRVALVATAPAVRDMQPWRFVLTSAALEFWADRRPQLAATETHGRPPSISWGEALHLAVLALAEEGWPTMTEQLPDPARPDLLARILVVGRAIGGRSVPREMTAAGQYRSGERSDLAGARSWADVLDVDTPACLGSATPPMPGAPDGPHAGGYPVDVVEFSRGVDGPARSRAVRDYPELAADAERLWLVITPRGGAIDLPAVPDRGAVLRSEPDRPAGPGPSS